MDPRVPKNMFCPTDERRSKQATSKHSTVTVNVGESVDSISAERNERHFSSTANTSTMTSSGPCDFGYPPAYSMYAPVSMMPQLHYTAASNPYYHYNGNTGLNNCTNHTLPSNNNTDAMPPECTRCANENYHLISPYTSSSLYFRAIPILYTSPRPEQVVCSCVPEQSASTSGYRCPSAPQVISNGPSPDTPTIVNQNVNVSAGTADPATAATNKRFVVPLEIMSFTDNHGRSWMCNCNCVRTRLGDEDVSAQVTAGSGTRKKILPVLSNSSSHVNDTYSCATTVGASDLAACVGRTSPEQLQGRNRRRNSDRKKKNGGSVPLGHNRRNPGQVKSPIDSHSTPNARSSRRLKPATGRDDIACTSDYVSYSDSNDCSDYDLDENRPNSLNSFSDCFDGVMWNTGIVTGQATEQDTREANHRARVRINEQTKEYGALSLSSTSSSNQSDDNCATNAVRATTPQQQRNSTDLDLPKPPSILKSAKRIRSDELFKHGCHTRLTEETGRGESKEPGPKAGPAGIRRLGRRRNGAVSRRGFHNAEDETMRLSDARGGRSLGNNQQQNQLKVTTDNRTRQLTRSNSTRYSVSHTEMQNLYNHQIENSRNSQTVHQNHNANLNNEVIMSRPTPTVSNHDRDRNPPRCSGSLAVAEVNRNIAAETVSNDRTRVRPTTGNNNSGCPEVTSTRSASENNPTVSVGVSTMRTRDMEMTANGHTAGRATTADSGLAARLQAQRAEDLWSADVPREEVNHRNLALQTAATDNSPRNARFQAQRVEDPWSADVPREEVNHRNLVLQRPTVDNDNPARSNLCLIRRRRAARLMAVPRNLASAELLPTMRGFELSPRRPARHRQVNVTSEARQCWRDHERITDRRTRSANTVGGPLRAKRNPRLEEELTRMQECDAEGSQSNGADDKAAVTTVRRTANQVEFQENEEMAEAQASEDKNEDRKGEGGFEEDSEAEF